MIVIYTQDKTFIHKDADSAKASIIGLYGEKLGFEAYSAVNKKRTGTMYRKHGGPLIKVVSCEEAERIRMKETAIGMIE